MKTRNGETWLSFDEAAARLGVERGHLERRAASRGEGRIDTELFGSHPHVRESDVERWESDGLPHPHWELLEAGAALRVPKSKDWLIVDRDRDPYGPRVVVALVPMVVGPHPGRHVYPGDILAKGEGGGGVRPPMVAELPLRFGLIRWLIDIGDRVLAGDILAEHEVALAEAQES